MLSEQLNCSQRIRDTLVSKTQDTHDLGVYRFTIYLESEVESEGSYLDSHRCNYTVDSRFDLTRS